MFRVLLSVYVLCVAADVPIMPTEYTSVMMLRMPYIGLQLPLRILTSKRAQKIEYYDGLQVDVSSPNGTHKYVFNNGKRDCLFTPSTPGPKLLEGDAWAPQVFFPDLSKYTLAGDGLVGGIMCKKYTLYAKHGTSGSMDDHVSFYWDSVLQKPVRWHMHNRPQPFGSHTDEYILDVLSFQAGAPAEIDLALPEQCKQHPTVADISIQIGSFLAYAHGTAVARSNDPSLLSFPAFLQQHGKSYAPAEHAVRREIFEKNSKLISELNRRHEGAATFKGNQFLDMTKEEVLQFRGGKRNGLSRDQRRTPQQQELVSAHVPSSSAVPPKSFEWRTAKPGVVPPVKDQAMCGSCWAYGAMGPIESIAAIQTGRYVELPEQFIVDCAWTNGTGSSGGNFGCDGGDSDIGVLEIVRKFGGVIPTAASYGSYLAVNGHCKDIRLMDVGAKITGWVDIKARDENGILDALATTGPLNVNIMVPEEMLYYESGVLKVDSCHYDPKQIDHAVVLTGYGTDEHGTDYYTIRNSWSTYWGNEGYINVARGDLDCCVGCEAGYPKLAQAAASVVV